MKETALITGASSGIGKEFALLHGATGGDLVLTARRESRLLDLKEQLEGAHPIKVHVFASDLASPSGCKELYEQVSAAGIQVDILINNAGFGGAGTHIDRPLGDELSMIDLNVRALVELTHRFATDMASRGHGRILNVGSTAGFVPGPNQAVYFATKAFVSSFSQAVDYELKDRGVSCTVLAPGYVETEFAQLAKLEDSAMVKAGGATAESVAKHGYQAMMKRKLVSINEKKLSFLMNWIIPLMPRRAVLKAIAKNQATK